MPSQRVIYQAIADLVRTNGRKCSSNEKGVGSFANKVYWSSSEIGSGGRWDQYFDDRSQEGGSQDGGSKDNDNRCVRALRAF